jgi:hypothetical protein
MAKNESERILVAIYRKGHEGQNGSIFDLVVYEGEYPELAEFVKRFWKRNARTGEPAFTTFHAKDLILYKKKVFDPIEFEENYSSGRATLISMEDIKPGR